VEEQFDQRLKTAFVPSRLRLDQRLKAAVERAPRPGRKTGNCVIIVIVMVIGMGVMFAEPKDASSPSSQTTTSYAPRTTDREDAAGTWATDVAVLEILCGAGTPCFERNVDAYTVHAVECIRERTSPASQQACMRQYLIQ